MPELAEVEVIVRGLKPRISGRIITAIPWLEPHVLANVTGKKLKAEITGLTIISVFRRGKYIVLELSRGYFLVIHLRMTGQLTIQSADYQSLKHTAFIFTLTDGALVFSDKRKFGRLFLSQDLENLPTLKKLGADALSITLKEFTSACKCRKPIKNLLLQQEKIAGLGNIYACEVLFAARVHPQTLAVNLSGAEIKNIHQQIKPILQQAIKAGGTSFSDYVNSAGAAGAFQKMLRVYQRTGEPCHVCQTPIQRIKMAARSTFFCPACQKGK